VTDRGSGEDFCPAEPRLHRLVASAFRPQQRRRLQGPRRYPGPLGPRLQGLDARNKGIDQRLVATVACVSVERFCRPASNIAASVCISAWWSAGAFSAIPEKKLPSSGPVAPPSTPMIAQPIVQQVGQ
jgi:hypothetical protein